jgi:transcriptional regulator with XRE-family HTH domain
MTQADLARRVGVHRSAVAQWESPGGSHPTTENCARIALSTAVSLEWLTTGRGRMLYVSDIVPGDETPALLLDHGAQCETEVRALMAMRKLDFRSLLAVVDMIEALGQTRALKVDRRTPYSR